jgi:hypothetical protein
MVGEGTLFTRNYNPRRYGNPSGQVTSCVIKGFHSGCDAMFGSVQRKMKSGMK